MEDASTCALGPVFSERLMFQACFQFPLKRLIKWIDRSFVKPLWPNMPPFPLPEPMNTPSSQLAVFVTLTTCHPDKAFSFYSKLNISVGVEA